MLGVIVGLLGLGMLLYLVPQGTTEEQTADVVAQVDGQPITVADVQTQLGRIERQGPIPAGMQPLYTQQILDQLVFAKELASESKRLGIEVTDQERADRIREIIPTAFAGDSFVGMEQYQTLVQNQTGLGVPEFEDLVTQSLIEDKFRQLVTDGIVVTPDEIQQEFRRRNEKVKIQYAVIKPEDLQAKIDPSDADLSAYFDQNKSRYAVPERRVVRYALLDPEQLKSRVNVSDADVTAYYNDHLAQYKLEDKVHVAHILFNSGHALQDVQEVLPVVLRHVDYSGTASLRTDSRSSGWSERAITISTRRPRAVSRSVSGPPGNQGVVGPTMSINRSTSLFSRASPRATEPNTRRFPAPCLAAMDWISDCLARSTSRALMPIF